MRRMWLTKFKREVEKYLKGTIIVKTESSLLLSGFELEVVKIIIHNECFNQPFIHNIGSVDNVMFFNPIDVAQSFISFYKGIIANKFFKETIDKN